MLKELLPSVSRVAVLWDPSQPTIAPRMGEAAAAAATLGVEIQSLPVNSPAELAGAYRAAAEARAGAVMLTGSPIFNRNAALLNGLEASIRLPTMYPGTVDAGQSGLIAYGANNGDLVRRTVSYVDQILRGANPADLPVQTPEKFDLRINLKTVQALGIAVPQSILVQATEIVR